MPLKSPNWTKSQIIALFPKTHFYLYFPTAIRKRENMAWLSFTSAELRIKWIAQVQRLQQLQDLSYHPHQRKRYCRYSEDCCFLISCEYRRHFSSANSL